MEFNLYKQELLRGIAAAETFEEAHKAWEAMCRKVNRRVKAEKKVSVEKEDLTPYTMEELNARIDESLASGTISHEESSRRIEQKFPWLCK